MIKYSVVFQVSNPGTDSRSFSFVVSASNIVEAIRKAQMQCGRTRFESVTAYRLYERFFENEEE